MFLPAALLFRICFFSLNSSTCFIVFCLFCFFWWGGSKGFVEFGDFLVTGAKIILVVTRDLTAILTPQRGGPRSLLRVKVKPSCILRLLRRFELLKEISTWISAERLAIDLDRPELLLCAQKSCPQQEPSITVTPACSLLPTPAFKPIQEHRPALLFQIFLVGGICQISTVVCLMWTAVADRLEARPDSWQTQHRRSKTAARPST